MLAVMMGKAVRNATNTGTTSLSVNETDVLLDGEIQVENVTLAVENVTGRSVWAPGETLTITIQNRTTVPNRTTVVTEFGVSKATEAVTVT